MSDLIFSIHIPKTAGGSFLGLLKTKFGDGLLPYYGPKHPTFERAKHYTVDDAADLTARGIRILHGHVHARRSKLSRTAQVISWVREPLQRAVSHHQHLKRQVEKKARPHKLLPNAEMPFETFIEQPAVQNFMCSYLDTEQPMNLVALGVVEQFDGSLALLSDRLGMPLPTGNFEVHKNPQRKTREYTVPDQVRARFYDLNAKDVQLYQRAETRLASFLEERAS